MADAVPETTVSLPEYLTARARGASDLRLAMDAIGGLLMILTFSFWRVPAWYALVGIGSCFLSYGAWAIANRELVESSDAPRRRLLALKTLSSMAATCGVAAGIFLIMVVLAKVLGRIIS